MSEIGRLEWPPREPGGCSQPLDDGWEPICRALGVDVPDEPFPHLHDTNEFRTEFGLAPI